MMFDGATLGFHAELRNFGQTYKLLVDEWVLYDNSGDEPIRLDEGYNSVKVSPRLCRGTHPGLTYTTVAYESPISTKRRRFVHERVPEPEPYPMGL